jgi:ABC-type branched-subunit amino acid transport system substrate-binding protein
MNWRMIGLVTLLAAACGAEQVPSKIVLAATLPTSSRNLGGTSAAWEHGYRRAVDEINASGGLLLHRLGARVRIELQLRDDSDDLARAEATAEQLLAAGAHVLLATPGAVRMAAQAAVAQRHQRPYAVPASAGPDLRATPRPWVLVASRAGTDDEDAAYQTARAAIDAIGRANAWEGEVLRRALATTTATGSAKP